MKIKIISALLLLITSNVFAQTKLQGNSPYINIIEYKQNATRSGTTAQHSNIDSYNIVSNKIEKSVFQQAVQSAIKELEGTMLNTCTRKMNVALKIEASGTWAIASIGIGGTIELEIMNPGMSKNCSK